MEFNQDILLAGISLLLILIGIIGSILPAIPGTILAWVGILVLKFSSYGESFSWWWVIGLFILVVLTKILDYFIPIWGVKKFGGSKYGMYGSIIGLLIGLFFPPFGFVAGPFCGALLGELIFNKSDQKVALKSSIGSVLGLLLGKILSISVSFIHLGLFFYATCRELFN